MTSAASPQTEAPARRIAIIGLGLIGTSIGLAARRAWPEVTLTGVDRDEVLRHPTVAGLFDQASIDPYDAIASDLLILATPVGATIDLLRQLSVPLRRHPMVLDTGSTKRSILHAARDVGVPSFVGGHPMAGNTHSGPGAARADLFDGRAWFVIQDRQANELLERARRFVEGLGARAVVMTDDGAEHDRVMAAVSHLPQVVASALMTLVGEAVGEAGLRSAGQGLRDTTRLASSPAGIWESVLASNFDELKPLLERLSDDLRLIAGQLDDAHAVRRLFDAASDYRTKLDSL